MWVGGSVVFAVRLYLGEGSAVYGWLVERDFDECVFHGEGRISAATARNQNNDQPS